jgi:hypothetical protein
MLGRGRVTVIVQSSDACRLVGSVCYLYDPYLDTPTESHLNDIPVKTIDTVSFHIRRLLLRFKSASGPIRIVHIYCRSRLLHFFFSMSRLGLSITHES